MARTITPIIAIILAVGLLLTYVKPTFEDIRAVQTETRDYVQAIERADALRARVNELVAEQNSFSTANLERLEALLPDERDDVSLMLAIDALARQHGLLFGNISIVDADEIELDEAPAQDFADIDPADAASQNPSGASVASPYTPAEISFTLTGTYEDFKDFLYELEHSLLLTDVTALSFTESEGDLVNYNMTIRTYAFNTKL